MSTEVTCPSCGTTSYFDEVQRDATSFCRSCDYPLFWIRSTTFAASDDRVGDVGLRRLPGAAGRVAVAMADCPVCTEPNPLSVDTCIRCGADMHPAPVPVIVPPPPAPEPEPVVVVAPPEPEPTPWWPWALAGGLAVIAAVILGILIF